jgi:hypothetical protein
MFKEVGAVNGKKQKHGYLVSKLARKLACQGVCVVKKGLSATSHPISLLQMFSDDLALYVENVEREMGGASQAECVSRLVVGGYESVCGGNPAITLGLRCSANRVVWGRAFLTPKKTNLFPSGYIRGWRGRKG